MGHLEELGALRAQAIWPGVAGRLVAGEQATLAVVELDPGSVVPEHEHVHEQLGVLLQGTVTFRVGEESRELGPGGTWRIPGGVRHAVRTGPAGAVAVEVFAPRREDWDALGDAPAGAPRWPPSPGGPGAA